ncbi:coiled-coil domain-containing protein 130 [Kwoniella heveanensis CBS 569]|nr:coiled-coil domain-containing protein 130 [Kwoniella heveanensis CBS 569]
MQGLNRYIPPDYDPKKNSTLNSYQGKKHALGNRAKDIDKGILIVRFELPFNIWCGHCNAHIGAGVRYNARKSKVGNYYSTPIYGFKCKCHLCDGWFEIRTDPKNAAYVVHEGARKKDEDWDPEENGGFAVHDTEAPSASLPPADPFEGVEKTIDQQKWAARGTSRLTELTRASERLSGDPYLISSALRRRFREEKKVLLEKQGKDDDIRTRYGLHEDVDLGMEDVEKGREMWIAQRENRGLSIDAPTSAGTQASENAERGSPTPRAINSYHGKGKGKLVDTGNGSPSLGEVLRKTTAKKYDPFANASFTSPSATFNKAVTGHGLDNVRVKGRIKSNVLSGLVGKSSPVGSKEKEREANDPAAGAGLAGGLLAGYGSD